MTTNGSNTPKEPSDIFDLGLKMLADAARGYFRDVRESAREEGKQVSDVWAQVTEKLRVPPTAKATEPKDSPREQLAFALATRAVTALEDIALTVAAINQRGERKESGYTRRRVDGDSGGPSTLRD